MDHAGKTLPVGTVTFLFADLEGPTRLLQQLGDRYPDVLGTYREILSTAATRYGGHEVGTAGDGSLLAFSRVTDAVAAAVDAQRDLAMHTWPHGERVRSRMGIHTGQPMIRGSDYVGIDVHRAARICDAAHGAQILVSDATRIVLEQALPQRVTLKLLGEHRLKDLLRAERLFQVLHPDLPHSFPPPRTLDAHPHNLPLQSTAFIGRTAELAHTRAALIDEGVRLLTCTGPGGAGKTRLALHLAARVIDHFRHGAFFVTLAHISAPSMVVPSIAQVLGVHETPGRPLLHNVQEYLKGKRILLVLDNLEQITEAARLVDDLLATCPEVQIIATSRERLRLSWEREFSVPAFEIPPRRPGDLDALAQNPAVALFVSRCRAVQPEFSLSPGNAESIVAICTRLEGLPLAIELAAARIKVLTPHQIAQRLDEQFRLFRGGPRDAPERHQSLHAAISWSYALLTPEEQRLFRTMAVFRGGFVLEAAEAVCGGRVDVLDGLSSMIDKSLLRRIAAPDGTPRFLMLETIREYGVERLAAEHELDEVRSRHARYFAAFADQLETHVVGPEEERWLSRAAREVPNLRAAMEWALQSADSPAAVRLGIGLGWLMYIRSYLTEERTRLAQILATSPPVQPIELARLMFPAGILAWSLGDAAQAQQWLDRALAVFREHGDAKREAGVTAFLGHLARSSGRLDEAAEHYQRALAICRDINNEEGVGWALHDLGLAARDRGADPEATALYEQSLGVFRKLGYRWGAAWALWNLGTLAHRRGDDVAAHQCFSESLELYRLLDDRRGIAQCLEGLAAIIFVAGNVPDAARVLSTADALRAGLGAPLLFSDRRDYERTLEGVKAALAVSEFERHWREGKGLDLEEALTLALRAAKAAIARQAEGARRPSDPLSPREREVAALIARGLSNMEIAAKLGVAERTAITHVEHIMNKLGLHARAQIAAWAVRRGLDLPVDP